MFSITDISFQYSISLHSDLNIDDRCFFDIEYCHFWRSVTSRTKINDKNIYDFEEAKNIAEIHFNKNFL
jgi:hypothetical protein